MAECEVVSSKEDSSKQTLAEAELKEQTEPARLAPWNTPTSTSLVVDSDSRISHGTVYTTFQPTTEDEPV